MHRFSEDQGRPLSAFVALKRGLAPLLGILSLWLGAAPHALSQARDNLGRPEPDIEEEKLLLVPITEPLDAGVAERLVRQIDQHVKEEPDYRTIVLRFAEGGGDARACEQFATYITERSDRTTVAWLDEVREPLGPAVIVAMACKEIMLGKDAVLAALPENPGEDAPDFGGDFKRLLDRYASRRNRPTMLARALITRDHDDILRVVFRPQGGAPENRGRWTAPGGREVAFMTRGEFDNLPHRVRNLELAEKEEVVCERGKALRMNAREAREWMFTEHQSASGVHELLLRLGLDIPDSNVVDLEHGAFAPSSRSGQAVVDFLNSPIVRILLIVGGCLGLLLELKMLGTMIPGAIGLACFLTLFVASLFPVTGSPVASATVFEILLFFIGVGLLAVEFLLLPGVAVFALAGGTLCLVSLVLIMVPPPASAYGDHMTVKEAIVTLVIGFGAGTLAFSALLRLSPRWSVVSQGGLVSHSALTGVPTADSALESQIKTSNLVGRIGVAETTLRPAGKVALEDGTSLDVVAEGEFIERGEQVVITGGTATRIIVARAPDDRPEPS